MIKEVAMCLQIYCHRPEKWKQGHSLPQPCSSDSSPFLFQQSLPLKELPAAEATHGPCSRVHSHASLVCKSSRVQTTCQERISRLSPILGGPTLLTINPLLSPAPTQSLFSSSNSTPEQFLPSVLPSKDKTSFSLNPRSIARFQGAVTRP